MLNVIPLLLGFFAILGLGMVLRVARTLPGEPTAVINALVIEVTMPALILSLLARSPVQAAALGAVLINIAALLIVSGLAVLLTRALHQPREVQGSAGMTAAFANTGFLGLPLIHALFGSRAGADGAAILVDSFCTSLMLWTYGVLLTVRFGHGGAFSARQALAVALKPIGLSVWIGLLLGALHLALPNWLQRALDALGGATAPLVFLSLGLALDPSVIRGRVRPLLLVAGLKLIVAPALVLGLVVLFRVPPPHGIVAVVDAAMPTALVSAILAARHGCDRGFAAGVAVVATLGTLLTLPGILLVLERLGL